MNEEKLDTTEKELPRDSSTKRGWRNIASTLGIILLAPVLAIFITLFIFQSYEVYGQSMESSLQNGDRLIVQKLSKNWSRVRGKEYVPQRGEIVVFSKPLFISSSAGDVDHLIKRVVGLPGERVVVADGKITIYNRENPEGFDPDVGQDFTKNLPATTQGSVDVTVGENEIFVCGDNRGNSLDSRSFGAISTDTITGIATLRFAPIDSFDRL